MLPGVHMGRTVSRGVERLSTIIRETVEQTCPPDVLLLGNLKTFSLTDFLELFPGWQLQGVQPEAMGRH